MGKTININVKERNGRENEVPDEVIDLPNKVHDANWHDDIPDEAEDETKEETSFEPYENEQDYKSSEIVSREAENLINAFERSKLQNFGDKTLRVFRKAA